MNNRFTHYSVRRNTVLFLVFAILVLGLPGAALAQSYALKTLYSFNGTDNMSPSGLTLDSQGNLYGVVGMTNRSGVYKYASTGIFTTLAVFDGLDGNAPSAPLIDADGNLWGTTVQGGVDWHPENNHYGWGTLYKISSTGVFTPGIVEFTGPHGAAPLANLTQDSLGTSLAPLQTAACSGIRHSVVSAPERSSSCRPLAW